jgi:hypothetical protein
MSTTPRDRLVAQVAVLKGMLAGIDEAWNLGEVYVAALELEPDTPRQCPCCTKLVTLCVKHYQLHEPGKPCVTCRSGE